jgi:hypothetical protein
MKIKHLEACKEYMDHYGITDLSSREAFVAMIDYAYSHPVGCDPDEFVDHMRRWHKSPVQSSTPK